MHLYLGILILQTKPSTKQDFFNMSTSKPFTYRQWQPDKNPQVNEINLTFIVLSTKRKSITVDLSLS